MSTWKITPGYDAKYGDGLISVVREFMIKTSGYSFKRAYAQYEQNTDFHSYLEG